MNRLRQEGPAEEEERQEAAKPPEPEKAQGSVPGALNSFLDGLGMPGTKAWLARKFDRADRIVQTFKHIHDWLSCSAVTWLLNLPVTRGRAACLAAFKTVAHGKDAEGNPTGLSPLKAAKALVFGVPAAIILCPITVPLTLGPRAAAAAFKRAALRKDAQGRRNVIAPKRTAAAILFSLPIAYAAVFYLYPFYYRNLGAFGHDAVAINLFHHRDVLVFGQANEVEGRPDVYAVPACFASPCEAQENTVQFRIRDSAYLDVLRLIDSFMNFDVSNTDIGELHDPSELAGAFLSGKSACYVEYYGRRHKTLGLYPHIIDATCEDIEDGNADGALERLRQRYIEADEHTV